jgi:hypothetical protein
MPQISAGLALEIPPRPPELVYPPSFPFRKSFWVYNAIWYSVLELDVFTSYDTWASLADVRINGVSIGKIPPRSSTQTGGELAPVSFLFANGMIQTIGSMGRTGFNQLEIAPPTPYDWLVVGNWRFHYYQSLPP